MIIGDKPWTIQISYTANGDDGRPFRARSAIHVNAPDIPSAYAEAEKAAINGAKLGAIVPGHHIGMF